MSEPRPSGRWSRNTPRRLRLRRALKRALAMPVINEVITFLVKEVVVDLLGRRPRFLSWIPKRGVVRLRIPEGREIQIATPGDDRIVDRIFFRDWDGYEPGMGRAFYECARSAEVILDVGAHVGFYSLLAAAAAPSASVHAFEPLERVRARLERNVTRNGARVRVVPSAVGAQEGEIPIFTDSTDHVPGESTLSSEVGTTKGFSSATTVPLTTIDSYVRSAQLPSVDVVKIDTEATELAVLEGMSRTLASFHPVIFCEVLDDFAQPQLIEQILRRHGYRFWLLTGGGPVEQEHVVPDRQWPNYMMAVSSPQDTPSLRG